MTDRTFVDKLVHKHTLCALKLKHMHPSMLICPWQQGCNYHGQDFLGQAAA